MKSTMTSLILICLIGAPGFADTSNVNCNIQQIELQNCVLNIPGGAYATFAGKFGGEVNRNDLLKNNEVGVAGCSTGSRIYTFELHVNFASSSTKYDGESHELTSEMLTSLRSLKAGENFEFKKIKARLPQGGKVDVVGRVFKVV